MEFKKNQLVEVEIDDMGNEGEGIGHADGYALFLKDAVAGDKVLARIIKIKKNYGFARVEKLLVPSPDRVEPRCPSARPCGGCTLQHLSYEKQLEYKFNKVKNCLERIGGIEMQALSWNRFMEWTSRIISEQSPVSCGTEQGWKTDHRVLCGTDSFYY